MQGCCSVVVAAGFRVFRVSAVGFRVEGRWVPDVVGLSLGCSFAVLG